MKRFYIVLFLLAASFSKVSGQEIGGRCEGCEAILEYGTKRLSPIDTLPEFQNQKHKLKVSGVIYQSDGTTPAEGVILYVYHTNDQGVYPTRGDEKGWAKRHGYIRGWVKTDKSGRYTFYTFKPAAYPNGRAPVHIHMTIKEPDKNEYWIDSIEFEDDPLLTRSERLRKSQRGGSGIVSTNLSPDGMLICTRNIILGLNIPNYR